MRISKVKTDIVKILSRSSHPLSVPEIQKNLTSNKTTIYRQIDQLLLEKQITTVNFSDGSIRYELTSLPHHHHRICIKCKNISDIKIPEQKFSLNQTATTPKFTVLFHHLEFFGLCHHCT